jgi:hypothetical protein
MSVQAFSYSDYEFSVRLADEKMRGRTVNISSSSCNTSVVVSMF